VPAAKSNVGTHSSYSFLNRRIHAARPSVRGAGTAAALLAARTSVFADVLHHAGGWSPHAAQFFFGPSGVFA